MSRATNNPSAVGSMRIEGTKLEDWLKTLPNGCKINKFTCDGLTVLWVKATNELYIVTDVENSWDH
jgi:hypothetical protein